MSFESFPASDGTLLAAHRSGRGSLPVVLANGLGGTFGAWHPLLGHLDGLCSFYSWDYRGLYRSEAPADRRSLTVEGAVDDLAALRRHHHLGSGVVAGWSMGVQVVLELYRRQPETVTGMVLMNGTHGRLFDTAFGLRVGRHVLPTSVKMLRQFAPFTGAIIETFADWPWAIPLAASVGLVDHNLDKRTFKQVLREFSRLDLDIYFEFMLRLSEHDATDALEKVRVPVLVIAGERDLVTPPSLSERMVRDMPNAELFIVPRASHYALLEYPEMVARRVERFLLDHFAGSEKPEPLAEATAI